MPWTIRAFCAESAATLQLSWPVNSKVSSLAISSALPYFKWYTVRTGSLSSDRLMLGGNVVLLLAPRIGSDDLLGVKCILVSFARCLKFLTDFSQREPFALRGNLQSQGLQQGSHLRFTRRRLVVILGLLMGGACFAGFVLRQGDVMQELSDSLLDLPYAQVFVLVSRSAFAPFRPFRRNRWCNRFLWRNIKPLQ